MTDHGPIETLEPTLACANPEASLISDRLEAALQARLGGVTGVMALRLTLAIPLGLKEAPAVLISPDCDFLVRDDRGTQSWTAWHELPLTDRGACAAIAMDLMTDAQLHRSLELDRALRGALDLLIEEDLDIDFLDLFVLPQTALLIRRDFEQHPLSMDTLAELDDDRLATCMTLISRRPVGSAHEHLAQARRIDEDRSLLARLTRFRHPDGHVEICPKLPV